MKYLLINSVYGVKSTGKIVQQQCHHLQKQGHTCLVAYGREGVLDEKIPQLKIGSKIDQAYHMFLSRFFDRHGFASKLATRRFLKKVEDYQPDVIWLHNLHGYYLHIGLLFRWLKEHPEIKVYWTLHDCWAFTGHCAYFTMARCNAWQTLCQNCPQLQTYPKCFGKGRVRENFLRKKALFTGVSQLTLITPSKWLADLTRQSFLAEYPVKVVHNEIDRQVFKPTENQIKRQYQILDKFLVLAMAIGLEATKGFIDMLKIRELLDERFVIVLVGLTKEQIRLLPAGVIGLKRLDSTQALAQLYTAADVFVNPTHQDNYPTVNLEAKACGTAVVTYDVGGSPESVPKENVIAEHDYAAMAKRIREICEDEQRKRNGSNKFYCKN